MPDMPPPPPGDSGWSSHIPPPPAPPEHSPRATAGRDTLDTGGEVELATGGRRLAARMLDWVIMSVVPLVPLLMAIAGVPVNVGLMGLVVIGLLAAVVGMLYEVTLIAVTGQTLGKMALKIKVVRADSGEVPGWGRSLLRWVIPAAPNLLVGFGWILSLLVYVSLVWDKVRQGWHDKAAGTLVTKI